MEETFRTLCVGLVTFPTPREIRLAARSVLFASAHAALRSLKDPDKLEPDFLTLVPTATDRFGDSRRIEHAGMVALLVQEGGFSLPGEMMVMPGLPNEAGRLEVKVGYLAQCPLNDWLNANLVGRLTETVQEVRADVLREVSATFEDRRTWYERASAHLKKLVGL